MSQRLTVTIRQKVKECKISFQSKKDEIEPIQTKVKALNQQIREIFKKTQN